MEVHQLQVPDEVIDVPVVLVAQVPHVQVVERTVEIPQLVSDVQVPQVQVEIETVQHLPVAVLGENRYDPEIQKVQDPRTAESLSTEGTVAEKIDHETVVQKSCQTSDLIPSLTILAELTARD